MRATAWNNGQHHPSGAGYGFKISIKDRNVYFKNSWETVEVKLPSGEVVEVNINKSSFWTDTCRELISKKFGIWLREKRLAPWKKGSPPKFELVSMNGRKFELKQT